MSLGVIRRRPRQVYRVYAEDEFFAAQQALAAAPPSLAARPSPAASRAGGRRVRGFVGVAALAGAAGMIGLIVAVDGIPGAVLPGGPSDRGGASALAARAPLVRSRVRRGRSAPTADLGRVARHASAGRPGRADRAARAGRLARADRSTPAVRPAPDGRLSTMSSRPSSASTPAGSSTRSPAGASSATAVAYAGGYRANDRPRQAPEFRFER
jgi:hypothetical protein